MDMFVQPLETSVKRLLKESQLISSDLTPGHLRYFFGLGTREELEGVVGLELFGTVGLLRFFDKHCRFHEPGYGIFQRGSQRCRRRG
jgi:hypothetical protein